MDASDCGGRKDKDEDPGRMCFEAKACRSGFYVNKGCVRPRVEESAGADF